MQYLDPSQVIKQDIPGIIVTSETVPSHFFTKEWGEGCYRFPFIT